MPAVEISGVTKTFGEVTAVNDLSLTVPEGSVFGFIGPNGSGKTTTMRMIVNIFYPDRGEIRVFGQAMSGARNHLIGYLPEERGLYRKMRVRALLEFFGELRGGRKVGREVAELAGEAGSGEMRRSRRVDTLSKGMSQKVQFIAAVVPEPKLLILDEPFSGLDPVSADMLRRPSWICGGGGATVILSTHDMTVAETMCDHILHDFPREESAGRHAGVDSGQVLERHDPGGGGRRMAALEDLPGVEKVRDLGPGAGVAHGAWGATRTQVLRALVERTRVTSFSMTKPSLHDIFVRIAGPAAGEVAGCRTCCVRFC